MIKVVVPEKEKLSFEEKVTRIENKILRDEEIFEFRLFVAEGFQLTCQVNAGSIPILKIGSVIVWC